MQLHQQVEKFWASEAYGFGNDGDIANSVEDNRALEILEGTTRLKNGRYEVGLLWRDAEQPILSREEIETVKETV